MKRVLLVLSVFFFSNLYAQNFSQGNSVINAGIGLMSFVNEGDYKTTFPPLEAQYEYFVSENISVGGTIAYTAAKDENSYLGYNYTYTITNFIFGGICNYKLYDQDKLNAYIGGKLAYDKVNVKLDSSDLELHEGAPTSGILLGAHVGGRYFVSDNLAINLEIGYGIALAKIGVSLKF